MSNYSRATTPTPSRRISQHFNKRAAARFGQSFHAASQIHKWYERLLGSGKLCRRLNSLQMELASPSTALSPAVKQLICCVGMGCDNKVLEDENLGQRVENETRDTDGIYVTSSAELKLDRVASLLPGNTPFNGACGTTSVHSDARHNRKHSSCS